MSENVRAEIDEGKFDDMLMIFKALGDQTRLKIVSLLIDGERNVGELAQLLDLTEPTVSHHLSKLRPTGIVRLRFDANQRFYSLNTDTMKKIGKSIITLDAFRFDFDDSEPDYSWLDALDINDFAKKTLRDCTENQRLITIPRKRAKLIVVLEWLVSSFERDRIYTEREVNEIIKKRHGDSAGLRRDLVDMGYLRRDKSGSKYIFEGSFLEYFQ